MKRFLPLLIVPFLLLGAPAAEGGRDLTGRWTGDDGGTYYLRQTGDQVHGYGEPADVSPAWTTVFSGRIVGDRIEGGWADVPKGRTGGSGRLELTVEGGGDVLRTVRETGGFRGTRWVRAAREPSRTGPSERLTPAGGEACVGFEPADIRVQQVNGRWRLVSDDHWLFDFGADPAAAHRALAVIRHYRMDRICHVARADRIFSYMLAKGGAPQGRLAGERCVAFEPQAIAVSRIQGNWKIVSGRRWLFDFGRDPQGAQQALAVIRQNGFTRSCSVGTPDAGFSYLRQ